MFGRNRRKAVKLALQYARPVLGAYNNAQEFSERLPENFWEDEYTTGYLLAIANHAFESVGGVHGTERGQAVYQYLTILSLNKMNDDQILQAVHSTSDDTIQGQCDALSDMEDTVKGRDRLINCFAERMMEVD